MRKVVSCFALVVAVIGLAQPAAASPPATATGTFALVGEDYTFLRAADGNAFFAGVLSLAYAGDITGSAVDTETFVVHPDGTFNVHGTEVCTSCTIGGRTGDFKAVFVLTGGPSFTQYTGHLTFVCGTGGLAGLHGGGTFIGTDAGSTYSYRYQFADDGAGRCP